MSCEEMIDQLWKVARLKQSCENPDVFYLEVPDDPIRIRFEDGHYAGWYHI